MFYMISKYKYLCLWYTAVGEQTAVDRPAVFSDIVHFDLSDLKVII